MIKTKKKDVVDNISTGDITKDHIWMTDVRRNKYVEEFFTHTRKGYLDNADGQLNLAKDLHATSSGLLSRSE